MLCRFNKAFIDIRLRPGIATPPEEDRATATGDLQTKFREDHSSGSRDMLADRQTHAQTDRQSDRNTPLPYRDGVRISIVQKDVFCFTSTTRAVFLSRFVSGFVRLFVCEKN